MGNMIFVRVIARVWEELDESKIFLPCPAYTSSAKMRSVIFIWHLPDIDRMHMRGVDLLFESRRFVTHVRHNRPSCVLVLVLVLWFIFRL